MQRPSFQAWRSLLALPLLAPLAQAQVELVRIDGTDPGGRFGFDVAVLGDVDGDGTSDWIVGASTDDTMFPAGGKAVLYSGATGSPLFTWYGPSAGQLFGHSVAPCGDLNGDGLPDVVVGAPSARTVYVYSGMSGLPIRTIVSSHSTFGHSVASGGDVDGDGVDDLLVGAARADLSGNNSGHVALHSGATGLLIREHASVGSLAHFGHSVEFIGDLDGDGRTEYIAGATSPYPGAGFSPYVEAFDGSTGALLWRSQGAHADIYGHSIQPIGDISGDGKPDVLVGAMQDAGVGCACSGQGFVRALDGVTGATLYTEDNTTGHYVGFGWDIAVVGDFNGNGSPDWVSSLPGTDGCFPGLGVRIHDGQDGAELAQVSAPLDTGHFGGSLDYGDINGDGLGEFLFGAQCSQPSGAYSGSVHVYSILREPTVYCEAKPNSLGCLPYIEGVGVPSETVPVPFRIKAFNVLNNKPGLLFYGARPQSVPFQEGRLCVAGSLTRTAVQFSGGNPPPSDCSGFYSFDFNDYIRSGADPSLIAGVQVYAQYWSRDAASPSGTGLTDALGFFIYP